MRTIEIELTAGDAAWSGLHGLLQAGFALESRPGLSLRDFMRESLLFPDEYIEQAVSTVFLDGKPVDDIDAALVREGSLVALSAAMPGLVGAVMRRNSPYASFRETISYAAGAADGAERPPANGKRGAERAACVVRVKLFNSVMRDRGPGILSRGAIVAAKEAAQVLGESFYAMRETTDGGAQEDGDPILLRVRARGDDAR